MAKAGKLVGYYREDETRYQIENFVRWRGDGAKVRCSLSVLDRLRIEMRRGSAAPIPALGVEAGRTAIILQRIEARRARALVLYHGTPYRIATMAHRLGLKSRQFLYLVKAAHPAYWAAMDDVIAEARARAGHPLGGMFHVDPELTVAAPRARPDHGPVTVILGPLSRPFVGGSSRTSNS